MKVQQFVIVGRGNLRERVDWATKWKKTRMRRYELDSLDLCVEAFVGEEEGEGEVRKRISS